MLHLIKYNLLVKLRNFNMVFWPLVFPLIMATFFFFAFGNLNDADFETVQVALVKESANPVFVFFLDQVQSGDSELIALHEMSEFLRAFYSPSWKVMKTICIRCRPS